MSKAALRDQIRDGIHDDIMSGRLVPGERLDELQIARRHKVSRTPVREAINRLAMNGLIEFRENKGAFVATISVARVLQICETMSALHTALARLAAQRIDETQLELLHRLAKEGLAASEQGDSDAYMAHNLAFHRAIGECSQNPFLLEETLRIGVLLAPYEREIFKSQRRMTISAQEHTAIAEAIAGGDADRAARMMEHHMDLLRDDHSGFLMLISRLTERQRAASNAVPDAAARTSGLKGRTRKSAGSPNA